MAAFGAIISWWRPRLSGQIVEISGCMHGAFET
jgi:hypothetical protein